MPAGASPHRSYDAFVSYSHAIDGQLAPRLQRALQAFARKGLQLRALRVFRDETSLSATPELWDTIEAALEQSRWFILLASPSAAASPWVEKEVRWWLKHRGLDRLLIAVTDGEIAGTARGATGSALPTALAAALREQPKWVDLRWARREEHLSLRDPRFRTAVADLGSAIHGRPKEDLFGEDVRQHRRRVLLARGAVAGLIVLALATAVGAVVALEQARVARAERDRATQQARLATSVSLATVANSRMAREPDLGMLLALEAYRMKPSFEARSALVAALRRDPQAVALVGPDENVWTAAVTANRRTLAVAGEAGVVRLWDTQRGTPVGRPFRAAPTQITGIATSAAGDLIATTGDEGGIRFWRPDGRRVGRSLEFGAGTVALSPDGRLLAAVGHWPGSGRLFDVAERRQIGAPLEGRVTAVAFSPDGVTLAATTEDRLYLYDLSVPRRRAVRSVAAPNAFFKAIAFSPDGRRLATGGSRVLLWDLVRAQPRAFALGQHLGAIEGVAFSDDGKVLASAGDDVRLWDVRRRSAFERPLIPRRVTAKAVAFGARSRLIAAGFGGIQYWDLRREAGPGLGQELERARSPLTAAALAPDGRTVALARENGHVLLRDVRNAALRATLTGVLPRPVYALAFSPDGRSLALGDEGGNVCVLSPPDSGNGCAPRRLGHEKVAALAFSPNGRRLVVSAGPALIVDPRTGRRTAPPMQFELSAGDLAVRSDGEVLAVVDEYGSVELASLETGERVGDGPVAASPAASFSLAFLPRSDTLAVMADDGAVGLFDSAEHKQLAAPQPGARTRGVALAAAPDGETLAIGDHDGVTLWDVRGRRRLTTLPGHEGLVEHVGFSADGHTLISGDDERVITWDAVLWAPGDAALRRLCPIIGRNLTRAEWRDLALGWAYHRTCDAIEAP